MEGDISKSQRQFDPLVAEVKTFSLVAQSICVDMSAVESGNTQGYKESLWLQKSGLVDSVITFLAGFYDNRSHTSFFSPKLGGRGSVFRVGRPVTGRLAGGFPLSPLKKIG